MGVAVGVDVGDGMRVLVGTDVDASVGAGVQAVSRKNARVKRKPLFFIILMLWGVVIGFRITIIR